MLNLIVNIIYSSNIFRQNIMLLQKKHKNTCEIFTNLFYINKQQTNKIIVSTNTIFGKIDEDYK